MPIHITDTGDQRINANLTVGGNISASGSINYNNTFVTTTSSLCAQANSPYPVPGLYISQAGSGDIASFYDVSTNREVFHIGGSDGIAGVGVNTSYPNTDFTVVGNISATGIIYNNAYNSTNWNTAYNTATAYQTSSATFILQGGNTLNTPLSIGTNDNYNLNLRTANATRMTITSAGNVGISTVTPNEKLSVSGNISASGNITAAATLLAPIVKGTGTDIIIQDGAGNGAFRSVRSTIGTDNLATQYFQAGNASDSITFTALNGTVISRLVYNASATQITAGARLSTPVPTNIFEIINSSNAPVFTVSNTGNISANNAVYTPNGSSDNWNNLRTSTSVVQIELPDNKNYILDARASYQYTLSSVYFYALSGSGNVSLSINGVTLPQLNQTTISQGQSSVALTTSNIVSVGQTLVATLSNNNFMYDFIMELTFTR